MTDPNRNALWARVLVDELGRLGVEHVCVGSGSRSSPLVVAFARDGRFRLHPHLDERSAAFFALGAGRATGRPAAVVTTSGTAAANLLPAVIEASQGETPLLLLTADRPPLLRNTDANQTIDQTRLFGVFPRLFLDLPLPRPRTDDLRRLRAVAGRAVAAALEEPAGPVHLNLPFEKPLEPCAVPGDIPAELAGEPGALEGRPDGAPWVRCAPRAGAPEPLARRLADRLARAHRPLVVCGPAARPDVGPAALRLAAAAGAPLLADPVSGARFAPDAPGTAIGAYDLFLADGEVAASLRPDLVVRIGPAPTSAAARRYLEESMEAPQLVIDAGGRWKDAAATASEVLRAGPAALCAAAAGRLADADAAGPIASHEWRARWRAAGDACRRAVAPAMEERFEGAVAAAVVESLPADATLFVGNSMPVRDVDAFAAPRPLRVRAIGFRGASGIDGNVSGAAGAAAAMGTPTAALLGDLTFLHDRNGLLAMAREGLPLAIVVIQNDGGGIFHMLPIRDYDPPFTEHIVMPHGIDLGAVAAVHGIPHRRADSIEALREALAEAVGAGEPRIVEVPVDRERNRARREAVAADARRAAREALREGPAGAPAPAQS